MDGELRVLETLSNMAVAGALFGLVSRNFDWGVVYEKEVYHATIMKRQARSEYEREVENYDCIQN